MMPEIISMAANFFVDTDIIIDLLIDRKPFVTSSSKIFELADQGKIALCTSTLCINNVHYICKKVLGDKQTRQVIEDLMELLQVLDVTENDLRVALKSNFKDFEDAIQHAVATREASIKSIITRNVKDYKKSSISVFDPDDFLKILVV
ncbi:type II toxin-antitoxin system VapC family toxin [Catalinimonas locisalis]|uniref:type II toxin-antitoxin system VapC family toxin n=1 Tax=Catalinimonas locisalis TaxID=3133978 RepID=UPI003101A952